MAFSSSGQWLSTTLFLGVGPTAFSTIGYRFYIVFIVSFFFYLFCYRCFYDADIVNK
jgi:uncharacterized membrane protein YgaE (UPF0421/DUF939 family)